MGFFKKNPDDKPPPAPADSKSAVEPPKSQDPPEEPTPAYDQPPPPSSIPQMMPTAQPPPPQLFQTYFACVSMNMTDRLRFINFPTEEFAVIRDQVPAIYPKGIQAVRPYGLAMEIKLVGNPWMMDHTGKNGSRRFVKLLLQLLYNRGWVLQAPVDLSKKESDTDSLIFRYQNPPPMPCDWLAVSFDRNDRLRFIEPPPPDLSDAILASLGPMVQSHKMASGSFEVKFHGYPWHPSGTETVSTRILVLNLLQTLEKFGWSLYASIDHQSGTSGTEADVLFFSRRLDWQPGAPIWHR